MLALIAYRIWDIQRKHDTGYSPALLIVVESGAIYSFTLISLLIGYGVGSLYSNISLDSVCNSSTMEVTVSDAAYRYHLLWYASLIVECPTSTF